MNNTLLQFLAVGLAGALGAMTRFALGITLGRLSQFPIATLFINVTGSFFLGWFLTSLGERWNISNPDTKNLLQFGIATGFLGAYTTFSTYMYESDKMLQDGLGLRFSFYLLGSLALGLIAVRFGVMLGKR